MAFNLSEGYVDLTVHDRKFDSVMGKVRRTLAGVSSKMQAVSQTAKKMFLASAAVAGVSLKAYASFEQAMRKATAVSDVTDKQFAHMSDMAEKQSIRLNMAATKTAEAFYYLGSAGLSVNDQIKAYVPVATLAKAATIEMGEAAEMVVDTMKGFKLGFENTGHVTDVMAKAVTSSNMTFSQLGEALAIVSGVARTTNNSLEETATLLATMADVGIKGSRAGTSLRRAMLNLAAPMSSMNKLLASYGIEIYTAEGKMKPFIQIVGEMSEKLKGASEEQKNMVFKTIFGARAIAGQIAIFDKGREALEAYRKGLENSGGTAEKIANKQMKAFAEQVGKVWRQVKTLARHIGEVLAPAFLELGEHTGKAIEKLTTLVDKHKRDVQEWAERVAARINFVKNLLWEFAKFMYTDFKEGAKFGLSAVLEEFKAFGKSLMVVMEKTFTDLYNNIGVWIKRAIAQKLTFDKYEMQFLKELGSEGGLLSLYPEESGKFMHSRAVEEAIRTQAKEMARKRLQYDIDYGIFETAYPSRETTTWEDVGKKILKIQEKALETIGEKAPPELVDAYKKEHEKLTKKLAEIEEKYARLRLEDAAELNEEVADKVTKAVETATSPAAPAVAKEPAKFGFAGLQEAWRSLATSLAEKKDNIPKATLDEQKKTTEELKAANRIHREANKALTSMAEDVARKIIESGLGTVAA